jgi:hypothetical protein
MPSDLDDKLSDLLGDAIERRGEAAGAFDDAMGGLLRFATPGAKPKDFDVRGFTSQFLAVIEAREEWERQETLCDAVRKLRRL